MNNRTKIFTYDFDHNILDTQTTRLLKNQQGEMIEVQGEINAKEYIKNNGYTLLSEEVSFQNYCDTGPRGTNIFVDDLVKALDQKLYGPSYPSYRKTIINAHDHAIITARAHHVDSLKKGFSILIHDILSQHDQDIFFDHLQRKYRLRGIKKHNDQLFDLYRDEIGRYPVSNPLLKQHIYQPELGKKGSAFYHYMKAIHERYPDQLLSAGFSDDVLDNIKEITKTINTIRTLYPHTHFVTYYTNNPDNIIKIRHTLKEHHTFDDLVQEITKETLP